MRLLRQDAGLMRLDDLGMDDRCRRLLEAALKANGKTYELHMYEGANHAFNNDTNAARYDKAAADLAWSRTIAFLKKNLA